jgi:sensor histidine kinase regulating citrate/malate metabolism
MLIQTGRQEDALTYLEEMSENMPEQLNLVDCGNRDMNTILNMEFSKAKRAGISFFYQLVVPPVLPFAISDLCSVVANLMDNAVEECARRKQAGKIPAELRVEIYPHKSYLFIMCSNDTDRKKLERCGRGIRTTKDDTLLHGYGTRIVAKVAEKYNGWAEYSLEDGKFVAKVILDMKAGEETV